MSESSAVLLKPGMSSVMSPASVEALALHEVSWVLIVTVCVVFVVTMAVLAWALRGRVRRRVPSAWWVLGGGVAFPVVVLTALLLYGTARTAGIEHTRAQPDLTVTVTGHLWWWDVRVHDPRSGQPVVLANELRLPVGRTTQIALQSFDVIHSFWVPALGGKRDLVPGRINHLVVTPTQPGVHRGLCAEYCGLQHAKMALNVVAMPPAEFDAWLAGQAQAAPEPQSPLQQRGRQAYLDQGCANCHAVRGVNGDGVGGGNGRVNEPRGPDLTHVASRTSLGAGTLPNGPGAMKRWLVGIQDLKPGARMPSYAHLDPATLDALAAYLESLR